MKGIYAQMQESSKIVSDFGKFTRKDLDNIWDCIVKAGIIDEERRILRNKEIEGNEKHLYKRAKELGKEIPIYLWYVMCSFNKVLVGSEFLEEYKEWL